VEGQEDGYERRLKTLGKGMIQQGLGLSTGSGTFGRYKIDAITLKAVGVGGEHDDIAFGRSDTSSSDAVLIFRVIESLCRSLNNLLEHLHQSFFFYFVLTPTGKTIGDPGRFVSIGTYLPAAMVMAASFTITAIGLWMQSSTAVPAPTPEKSDITPEVVPPGSMSIGFQLGVVAVLHGLGFIVLTCFDWIQSTNSPLLPVNQSFLQLN